MKQTLGRTRGSDNKDGYSIRSVDRALLILSCFNLSRSRLNLVQISDLLDLDKSTVYRMLCTLESRGFVHRDPISQHYELGLKMLELGNVAVRKSNLTLLARPELEKLRDVSEETTGLFYWAQASRVCVDQVESHHPIRQIHTIGQPRSLLPGAIGRAILSSLSQERIDAILHELDRTYGVVVDRRILALALEEVRLQGFGLSRGESTIGAEAVISPIRMHGGPAIAAIGIYGPRTRLTPDRAMALGEVVRDTAITISTLLENG